MAEVTENGIEVLEFSHLDPSGPLEHFTMFDQARAQHDVFRSSAMANCWVFTRRDDQREIFCNTADFSTKNGGPKDPDPSYLWIPMMLDPPIHTTWRKLLAPSFSPRRISELDGRLRARCVDLIEGFAEQGECDFVAD